MLPQLSLTLFVKTGDPMSDRAREVLQTVLTHVAEETTVDVRMASETEAAQLGISIAPILRIQRGTDTPEWLVHLDRESILDRLTALGVLSPL